MINVELISLYPNLEKWIVFIISNIMLISSNKTFMSFITTY